MSFGISPYHIALAGLGAVIILGYWLPRFPPGHKPTSSALLIFGGALVFGFIPDMPVQFDPVERPLLWTVTSEIVVIVALFGAGIRIDKAFNLSKWKPALRLVLLAMPLTIAAVAMLGFWLGFGLAAAILLGAAIAPTDPVLAADLQVGPPQEGGEHPVRFSLTTEAGLNDALAFPFVYAAILIASGTFGWGEWLGFYVSYKLIVGLLCGAVAGWVLGKILFVIPRQARLADTNTGVVAIAGVFATYGLCELAEGYGFLAVFVMALVLRREEAEHEFHKSLHEFSEAIEHTLTALLLVALGAALPLLWQYFDWRMAAVIACCIFIVRPAISWISLIGSDLTTHKRGVVAFYGVRGIGSVFYLAYALSEAEFAEAGRLWALVAFLIFASTIVHGLSAPKAISRVTQKSV